jgi:hypothetical protein
VHRFIHHCAGNPYLEDTLGRYFNLSLRIWYLSWQPFALIYQMQVSRVNAPPGGTPAVGGGSCQHGADAVAKAPNAQR